MTCRVLKENATMLNTKFWTLLSLSAVLLFWSCNEENNLPPPPNALNYFPLEVGAYWIYEIYTQQPDQAEVIQGFDTLEVTNSYQDGEDVVFELSRSGNYEFSTFFPDQLRLSDGELIAENGDLILTVNDDNAGMIVRTDSLAANLGFVYYRFLADTEDITVPAGTFACINFEGEIVPSDPEEEINGKRINRYYSEGVGLVDASNFFFNGAGKIGIRLNSFELP